MSCFLAARSAQAVGESHITIIYDGKVTALLPPAEFAAAKLAKTGDLWITLADLTRATGFEVKPQGVCRNELCFPLPKDRRADFLAQQRSTKWFNLTAFARLLKQPVARDDKLGVWIFGPRPDVQSSYLASLEAPNFTLPDMNGKMHSLSDFRGKKVLLVTWASW